MRALLLLTVLAALEGCASVPVRGDEGDWGETKPDAFQVMQEASGLAEATRHPAGAALYQKQALELLGWMVKTPVTYANGAPRQALAWLLREVLAGRERVEYADLAWRARRFASLVLVRPDGYLVEALTGAPLQRLGSPKVEEGAWKVGRLRIGEFYFSQAGVLYAANEALGRAGGPPLAELGLGRDPANAALEGTQDALGQMVMALGRSVLHPIRGVEDLTQLPTGVARLIASSPEYFARYGAMSQEDQIREAARLATHVVMMLGGGASAVGQVGSLSGLGAELPVLSLTAQGEWVLGGTVVVAGAGMATLGVDLGALSILSMVGSGQGSSGGRGARAGPAASATTKGPGRWVYKTPTTESEQARDYQEQVTGRPAWQVYVIGTVEFDGFNGKELLEAKGASYKNFLTKDGRAQPWFKKSDGYRGLIEQARKQAEVARALKLPLVWHVAEAEFARFLRQLFMEREMGGIEVRDTPPLK